MNPHEAHPVVRRAMQGSAVPAGLIAIDGKTYDPAAIPHPGGDAWLEVCKGTDATRIFELSHLNIEKARGLLEKIPHVGKVAAAETDRSTYAPLRREMLARFPTRESRAATPAALLRFELCGYAVLAAHALLLRAEPWTGAWAAWCVGSALLNTAWGGMGHNFLHRLDWRAVALDWNGLSAYEWLLEHVLSHHPQPNTPADHDSISMLPFVDWLRPNRRGALLVFLGIAAIGEIVVAAQGNLGHRCRWRAPAAMPLWLRLAPVLFVARLATYFLAHGAAGLATALLTMSIASAYFSILAHLNHAVGGADTADLAHQQLRNTADLPDLGAATLGLDRQTLHHLFPVLDHSRLDSAARTLAQRHVSLRRAGFAELFAEMASRLVRGVPPLTIPCASSLADVG